MSDLLLFFYALVGMFVLACCHRNVRQQRPHSRTLTLVGWGMMSSSATLGVLLAAYATWLLVTPSL
ncbi:hypothetical protein [Sphingomonas sanxanigenens]|uniref:Uncharacterized protein n=1 Tax=Sphingomonas sanxanigenens DSM 19645 = NX02 TaxID=1123269 RepID=W0A7W3_9SPHN|nr:hypothetical protein [Sphingomonas sanxanigenens]AHE52557.1 hypothetical protein NX02_04020 [Sphingomonas sanxanigenens DSM 19645 = NX02]